MKIENFIALRYIKSKKETRAISFISAIAVIGIILGVATLIVVTNVFTGFENNLKEKILGANSHIIVNRVDVSNIDNWREAEEKIRSVKGVKAVSPFIFSQVLLTGPNNVSGVMLRGVIPEKESEAINIKQFITTGNFEHIKHYYDNKSGIVLGKDLALTLGVRLYDEVVMVAPFGKKGPFGFTPKMQKFNVVGIFDSGMFDYNSGLAFIDIKAAQQFFDYGDVVSAFSIKVDDIDNAPKIAKTIADKLDFPFWARDWLSMNKNLFSALELEKSAMFIVLTLIVIVASFNIVSLITMTVKDKKRDIAILRAMGASEKIIQRIFIKQGMIIGLAGTLIGDILAYVICVVIKKYKIISLPKDIYFMDRIPVEIVPEVFLIVTAAAIIITYLSALYPAKQGARMDPIAALRND
ncbi:MAG: lipoprotein-releasing ABC transporter permease subunit [Calditerrivibrio sp.]|nr:lipoprotein-releasing ABC transporter permease subunit [Calditerrivibrio sp.]MCA1933324.1 lipoprotein-releasing ABC transporter permease subunit [Calditerrivibrio sp.]